MLATDRSGTRKIGCTSGNEMPCPDHVVIEVQSFCRKLGRAGPRKEALRVVEPRILFRQDAVHILISRGARVPGDVDVNPR